MRTKISGTAERPRLNVYRSNKHIYAQLIDDMNGVTIVSASTMDKEVEAGSTGNAASAAKVGELIAKKLLKKTSSRLFSTVADIFSMAVLKLLLMQHAKMDWNFN